MPYMNFDFSDNYYIYFMAYLVIPVLFFFKAKVVHKVDRIFFMSKSSTDQLRGIFIVVMVIHHISQRMANPGLLTPFNYMGYFAVGMFFFFSGFGLTKSFKNNETYLDHFLINKLSKIYVPFIIVNTLTVVALIVKGDNLSVLEILEFSLSIKMIDTTQWFIITILIFYVFFWISFITKKNDLTPQISVTIFVFLFIISCKYMGLGGWWYYSSLCFPLGVIFAYNEKKIFEIIYNKYNLILIASLVSFILTLFLFLKSIFPAMGLISCILFTIFIAVLFLKISPCFKLFSTLGNISMEIYIIHMKILALFVCFVPFNSSLIIIPYFIVLILLSVYFNKFNNFVYNKLLHVKTVA